MKKVDRAMLFSLQYLQILEEHLDLKSDDVGRLFSTKKITSTTLSKLKKEILSLFRSKTLDDAIIDSREYGTEYIQTIGFGLIPHTDFNKFVKMGFLCGTRLLLWDLIGSRILGKVDDSPDRITSTLLAASNLIPLKRVVEKGGLVILPHPPIWSENARYQLEQFLKTRNTDTMHYGLVTALSVMEEITLHPYTLFPNRSLKWPRHPAELKGHEYYPQEAYVFHKLLDDLFEDNRFAYLKEASPADFYEIISSDISFQIELKKLLTPPRSVHSPQQLSQHSNTVRDSLINELKSRNKQLIAIGIGKLGTELAFVATLGTTLNSVALGSVNPIGIAIMGISGTLFQFLSRTLEKKRGNIIVQTFIEISKAKNIKVNT